MKKIFFLLLFCNIGFSQQMQIFCNQAQVCKFTPPEKEGNCKPYDNEALILINEPHTIINIIDNNNKYTYFVLEEIQKSSDTYFTYKVIEEGGVTYYFTFNLDSKYLNIIKTVDESKTILSFFMNKIL